MAGERRKLTVAAEIAGIVGGITAVITLSLSLISGAPSGNQSAPPKPTRSMITSPYSPVAAAPSSPSATAQAPNASTSPVSEGASVPSQHPLENALLLALLIAIGLPLSVFILLFVIFREESSSFAEFAVFFVALILAIVAPAYTIGLPIHYLNTPTHTPVDNSELYRIWGVAAMAGVVISVPAIKYALKLAARRRVTK